MNKNIGIILYLSLLLVTIAHIFEEVWGNFWLIDDLFGLGWFLVINWLLLCIPFVILVFILIGKRWAYYVGVLYAGLMVLNGIGHIALTMVTGNYFGGYAGGYTGIGLAIIGIPLAYTLWKTRTGI